MKHKASKKDLGYEKVLSTLEERHLTTIKELFPLQEQSSILSHIKSSLNELETLIRGAYLIGEYTPRLSDKVVSYGELLSSFIISSYFKSSGLDATCKNGRQLIFTDESFGNAKVDFDLTNTTCSNYFSNTNSDEAK